MDGLFANGGFLRGNTAMILSDGRVVFARRVDVRMSQYIGNEINISGFTVKIGTEGAAELMRTDFFFLSGAAIAAYFLTMFSTARCVIRRR